MPRRNVLRNRRHRRRHLPPLSLMPQRRPKRRRCWTTRPRPRSNNSARSPYRSRSKLRIVWSKRQQPLSSSRKSTIRRQSLWRDTLSQTNNLRDVYWMMCFLRMDRLTQLTKKVMKIVGSKPKPNILILDLLITIYILYVCGERAYDSPRTPIAFQSNFHRGCGYICRLRQSIYSVPLLTNISILIA